MSSPNYSQVHIASALLAVIARSESAMDFREQALAVVSDILEGGRVAWVHQQGPHWEVAGSAGSLAHMPIDLAASACDDMEVTVGEGWLAAPIAGRTMPSEVLLIHPYNLIGVEEATALAAVLNHGLLLSAEQAGLNARVSQLQRLLDLAVHWQRTGDLTSLLENIAQAAARVLNGDRASIFLWDKATSELVGHPALGVGDETLRIRDDQGIAGEVLRSRKARRWDDSEDPRAINKTVGKQLGYATHSLLAVPLLDKHNKPLGVFEVLNHRNGAFSDSDQEFLLELAKHASAALENTQRIEALMRSRDRLVATASETLQMIGNCHQVLALRDTISRVAATDLAVLVLGENGTGKEVVARSMHLQSARRDQAFVAVNCAAIAESLLESELFGHAKGAFTDAISDRPGKFESADGGTLLLDEIGEMSLGGQAKLLRVLEDKIVTRVGSESPIQTDVRIIAATNQELAKLVREKRFREDLYFRLNVVTLQLPPLRERGADVIVLAEFFLTQFGHQIGRRPPTLSDSAKRRLLAHSWPGNIRELRNLMERVAYLTNGSVVEETDLAFVLSPGSSSDVGAVPSNMPLVDATAVFQRQYIQRHVECAGNNLAAAARQLGMHRSNLYRKMVQLGMEQ